MGVHQCVHFCPHLISLCQPNEGSSITCMEFVVKPNYSEFSCLLFMHYFEFIVASQDDEKRTRKFGWVIISRRSSSSSIRRVSLFTLSVLSPIHIHAKAHYVYIVLFRVYSLVTHANRLQTIGHCRNEFRAQSYLLGGVCRQKHLQEKLVSFLLLVIIVNAIWRSRDSCHSNSLARLFCSIRTIWEVQTDTIEGIFVLVSSILMCYSSGNNNL